ncbi:MAG: ABC transporter ATP-binding protein [Candidatus Saganbacteria bacterium]|nr:ABC transporter ATP-binding protein [Candidatus Saganbacteria bacterium]
MIEIVGLTKDFGSNRVLNNINLAVKRGQSLAVIGPSGCGKSTLLKLIIGLFPPTSGKIFVAGREITGLGTEEAGKIRKHMGMIFQSGALFDSLSVAENVAFGLREHTRLSDREIAKIVSERLNMVGLSGTENLMPIELSGGMQKRVSLARALATDPEIIFYDEPTTGLDPITANSIEDIILSLHKKLKVTSIVVTHMLSTVYKISDRITMLHEGNIIEAGSPEETKRSQNPVIRKFITGGAE